MEISYKVQRDFQISDFRTLSASYERTFDAVLCVGNSLSHIVTDKDLQESIGEMYKVLNTNGVFILHLRNYQKVLKEKQRFFAHKSRDEIFFYVWDFEPEYTVNIINYNTNQDRIESCSFPYNPIIKSKATGLLRKAGFKKLHYFGDNRFKKFNATTDDHLIVVCKK